MKKLVFGTLILFGSLASSLQSAQLYLLDAASSTLVAAALKNESVTVKVTFPGLSGTLDPAKAQAKVSADLKSLSTGDLARDSTIAGYFFEVAKKAAYGTATFHCQGKPEKIKALKVGQPQGVTLTGKLRLHGAMTALKGPAEISLLADGSYKASFKDWVIDIKKSKMGGPLARLNKVCPQPHRVGNEVLLSGELVFKKP